MRVLVVGDRFVPAGSLVTASADGTGRVPRVRQVPPKPPVYSVKAARGRPACTGAPQETLSRRCVAGLTAAPDPGWV